MTVLFLQQQKTVCDFLIRPRPLSVEHNVLMLVCLSVCLSLLYLTLSRKRLKLAESKRMTRVTGF